MPGEFTEEYLNSLHANDLFDLMVKTTNELLLLNKDPENKIAIKEKQKDVELIQRVIVIRRSEFPPL